MTKTATPPPKPEAEKPKKTKTVFKPDIRLASAMVRAIAFLQKTGFQATPQVIRKCISARSKKGFNNGLDQLPLYLARGLELGILKRWQGAYKLGDFNSRKKTSKKKKPQKSEIQSVEVIKDVAKKMRSMCSFYGRPPSFCLCFK